MEGQIQTEAVRDPSIFTKSEARTAPAESFYPVGSAMICSLNDPKHRGSEPEAMMLGGSAINQLRAVVNPKSTAQFDSADVPPPNEDGDEISTRIILQTLGASPENPYLVEFEQLISEEFTGEDGQLDLVERDSVRRSYAGVTNGTTTISDPSGEMNWQSEDEGEFLKLGRYPGFQLLRIESVLDPETVVVDRVIDRELTDLTLEMDGKAETTLATKDGFGAKGISSEDGKWSVYAKTITSDKVYTVVFAPGETGKGIFTAKARALNESLSVSTGSAPAPTESDLELSADRSHGGLNIFDPIMQDHPGYFEGETQLITGLTGLAAFALIEVYALIYTETAIAVAGAAAPEIPTFVASNGVAYACESPAMAEAWAAWDAAVAAGDREAMAVAVDNIKFIAIGAVELTPYASLAPTIFTAGDAAAMVALSAYGVPDPLTDIYSHFGIYLNGYFPGGAPWSGGDSTAPGFPGFAGPNAPLQPGVRCYISYVNGDPTGAPPICFFED